MTHFLKEFFTTGAVGPSSSYLAEAMTNPVFLGTSKCVVELGPGTGAITQKIIDKIPQDCTFLTLEIDPVFAETIQKNYPSAKVYSDSAHNLPKYLQKNKIKQCDAIISSLPWTFIEKEIQQQILNNISQSLAPNGKMTTFFHLVNLSPWSGRRVKKYLEKNFSQVEKKIVWKNFPPAVVYECKK